MIAMIGVFERIRPKIFLSFLLLSCFTFLYNKRNTEHTISKFEDETEANVNSKTFQLEHCNCSRTLVDVKENTNDSVQFLKTTCSRDAFQRGPNQKVVGFSFYGDSSSEAHKAREYFGGIQENLRLVRSQYGADWSLRLYYDLAQSDELMGRLCELACNNSHLDLCNVRDGYISRLGSHWSRAS